MIQNGLHKIRTKKCISVAKLARISGVSEWTIYKYERGQRLIENASYSILLSLATALDCKIEDLVKLEEID